MPGYTNSLNPKEEELKQILGKYEFLTHQKCGLSNCGTPHGKGYIVETASGKLTNIGSYCGKKHFSVEFENLSREFDRYYRDYKARERIGAFSRSIDSQFAAIKNIENNFGNIDITYKIQQFFKGKSKECPEIITQKLNKMVKENDPSIYVDKRLSNEEVELRKTSGQKNISRYERIAIDRLTGLPFLHDYNDLRLLYAVEFKKPVEEISILEIDSLISKDLDFWSKKIGELDGTIRQIRAVMQNSQDFLKPENIVKIEKIIPESPDDFNYLLFILNANYSINFN